MHSSSALHRRSSSAGTLVPLTQKPLETSHNPQNTQIASFFASLVQQNTVLLQSNLEKERKIEELTQKLHELELTLSLDLAPTIHSLSNAILIGILDLYPSVAAPLSTFIQHHHSKTRIDIFFNELKKGYGYLIAEETPFSEKEVEEIDLEIVELEEKDKIQEEEKEKKRALIRTLWGKLDEDIVLSLSHNKTIPVLDFPPETSKIWTTGVALTSTLFSTASTGASFATSVMSIGGALTTMGLWGILANETALSTLLRIIRAVGHI